MEYQVAAKGTKHGNKASGGVRVPVGTLHYVDVDNQDIMNSMYLAICGETHLMAVDVDWHGSVQNERCGECENIEWQATFAQEQARLLK